MPIDAFEPIQDWNLVPLVRLSQLIQAESWFTGTCNINMMEEVWKEGSCIKWPDLLRLTIAYRGDTITVEILLSSFSRKFVVSYPNQPRRRKRNDPPHIPQKSASTYLKAIHHTKGIIGEIKHRLDPRIDAIEKRKLREAHTEKEVQNTIEQLRIGGLVRGRYNTDRIYFRENEAFALAFKVCVDPDKETKYDILEINGMFTLEELRKIIEFVGACPSAVAAKFSQ